MQKFIEIYHELNLETLPCLAEIYTRDVCFIDPAHKINGLDPLMAYFASLYQNITAPKFRFYQPVQSTSDAYVQWEMDFSHPGLKNGRIITVCGASYLRFIHDGRVVFHRDYFDLGAMLYEHIPLLGRIIIMLKRRLGS